MELETAFKARLLGTAPLTALVNTRIFSDSLPLGTTLPAVEFFKVSDGKDYTLAGLSPLEHPIFQFTVHAKTKPSARAAADQIKAALIGFVGMMNGGVNTQLVQLISEGSSEDNSGQPTIYFEDLEIQFYFLKG